MAHEINTTNADQPEQSDSAARFLRWPKGFTTSAEVRLLAKLRGVSRWEAAGLVMELHEWADAHADADGHVLIDLIRKMEPDVKACFKMVAAIPMVWRTDDGRAHFFKLQEFRPRQSLTHPTHLGGSVPRTRTRDTRGPQDGQGGRS